jgi:hypothetical protein
VALSGDTRKNFFNERREGCHRSKRIRNNLRSHSRAPSKLTNKSRAQKIEEIARIEGVDSVA